MLRSISRTPLSLCSSCTKRYASRATTTTQQRKTQPSTSHGQAPRSKMEPVIAAPETRSKSPTTSRGSDGAMLRTYRPRTPGLRHLKRPINDHLWRGRPVRRLTYAKKGHGRGGRNRTGRITVRHRGGGHARRIRTVDFVRMQPGAHLVERIEYDPNRSAHIALVKSKKTGEQSYIIAAEGMRAGEEVQSYRAGIPHELIQSMGGTLDPGMLAVKTALRGNCMPLRMVPIGAQVYNVGLARGKAAVFCRSAGTYATIVAKEENRKGVKEVHVKLQSGEVRRINPEACATIGIASNHRHSFRSLGKAGRSRWLGIRPTVRGVAMNSNDHPHGGGRGKSKGNRVPVSPWGLLSKSGYKTRSPSKSNNHVVHERHRNQGKRRSTE